MNAAVTPPLVELLHFLTANVVSNGEAIRISRVETPKTDLFYLTVSPSDLGRLLGREGKTVEAIRVVLDVAASRYGKSAVVDVVEPRRKPGERSAKRRRAPGTRRRRGGPRAPKVR